jgi:hypothetical protein
MNVGSTVRYTEDEIARAVELGNTDLEYLRKPGEIVEGPFGEGGDSERRYWTVRWPDTGCESTIYESALQELRPTTPRLLSAPRG